MLRGRPPPPPERLERGEREELEEPDGRAEWRDGCRELLAPPVDFVGVIIKLRNKLRRSQAVSARDVRRNDSLKIIVH